MTVFAHVEPFAGDPILALVEVFQADPRPHKVNLSIGIYFDEEGRIPVLKAVKAAIIATCIGQSCRFIPLLPCAEKWRRCGWRLRRHPEL